MRVTEHAIDVPLDHLKPDGPQIQIFVRKIQQESKRDQKDRKFLLFLQGGPGFPANRPTVPPSGWQKAALNKFDLLMLDMRGTGRSTPATPQHLASLGSPQAQAEYLSHFRATDIIHDCERVRAALADGSQFTLLGQSFGGFCILSYLSLFPNAIERALFTFGLAPVRQHIDDVYRATFKRMKARNLRFYRRYPEDIELVRSLVRHLNEVSLHFVFLPLSILSRYPYASRCAHSDMTKFLAVVSLMVSPCVDLNFNSLPDRWHDFVQKVFIAPEQSAFMYMQ